MASVTATAASDGPVVAIRVSVIGRADHDRMTRAGYLPESQHHVLPVSAGGEPPQPPGSRATALKLPRASRRLRPCAYARDRSVPGPVRDIVARRLRLCPGLGPRGAAQP